MTSNLCINNCLEFHTNRILRKGTIKATSEKYSVCSRIMSRTWSRTYMISMNLTLPADVRSRTNNCGRKSINEFEIPNRIQSVHVSKCTTLASLATRSVIALTTWHRAKSNRHILRCSSAVIQLLTPGNKLGRFHFALSSVKCMSHQRKYNFKGMHDLVDIDEKWINVMDIIRHITKTPDSELSHGIKKCKWIKIMVMFLCAMTRQRYNHNKHKILMKPWHDRS